MSIQNTPHFQKLTSALLGAKQRAKKNTHLGLARNRTDDAQSRLHPIEDLGPSSEGHGPLVSSDRPHVEILKLANPISRAKALAHTLRKIGGREDNPEILTYAQSDAKTNEAASPAIRSSAQRELDETDIPSPTTKVDISPLYQEIPPSTVGEASSERLDWEPVANTLPLDLNGIETKTSKADKSTSESDSKLRPSQENILRIAEGAKDSWANMITLSDHNARLREGDPLAKGINSIAFTVTKMVHDNPSSAFEAIKKYAEENHRYVMGKAIGAGAMAATPGGLTRQ